MRDCTKCNKPREEKEFYNNRKVCKYCHREYVYEKRVYERAASKSNSSKKEVVIKTLSLIHI